MNTITNDTAPIEFLYKNEEEAFVEDILATHDEEIDSNGGYRRDDEITSFGAIPHSQSIDKVSSVVDSVFVSHFEQRPSDRFTDIFEQTSYFAQHLASEHPSGDANKGTTVRMALAIISIRGIFLDLDDSVKAEDNEIYQWIQRLVTHECSYFELANMLRERAIFE